ncbi:MAG: helix-turn-helix transcriptional regulator [Sphingobacteriales bacterium]|nr:helix-turn-helix transcriptional regulator [Sphingobacteriales bacterium]
MQDDIILKIGDEIKIRRKEKGITVQELADRSNVSKGLISQIENGRTMPSLLVLIEIIKSLDTDLNVFFKEIKLKNELDAVIIKRREDYEKFEKEDTIGFDYQRIFTKSFNKNTIDIVLLELSPKASRPMVITEAFEFKYIIKGKVDYQIENNNYFLQEGDAMLFDGRLLHTPTNNYDESCLMLIIYFFEN